MGLMPDMGNWLRRLFHKCEEIAREPQVAERIEKGTRAVELALIHTQEAAIDEVEARAVGTLLHSLEGISDAVCQIRGILLVKFPTKCGGVHLCIRTLNPDEMMYLERNQKILRSPAKTLQALSKLNKQGSELLEARR